MCLSYKAGLLFDPLASRIFIGFMKYLACEPLYMERVWGGRALEKSLGRTLPAEAVIGESWEIVDRAEANSTVSGTGKTLADLRQENAAWLMGPAWRAEDPFPILVKWLDCEERLSLQVHPPAAVAPSLGGEPKTENWYIVESKGDSALLAGVKAGVTPEAFREALEAERLEGLVCRLPSKAGDSLFVESGRLHAIDAGNLILEIQQNSDTTYRVYDWGRVGLDGKPRQLHIEESMASINFSDTEPDLLHPEGPEVVIADSAEFRIRRLELAAGASLDFGANEEPRILSVVEGKLRAEDGVLFERGTNLILPYAEASRWSVEEDVVLLLTDHFGA
jgi:mannose-6-phosphate isomerase